MGTKEIFEKVFKEKTGKDASSFKGNAKGFAEELNKSSKLRELFRAAVEDTKPDEGQAGFAALFGA